MQLHQQTQFDRPRAGSLLQFLITLCMLICNINQTFTSRDTFSFHAGMLTCVYETGECVCQWIKRGWSVSPYHQSLMSYLQNLQNICELMMPLPTKWKPTRLTQTRYVLCNRVGKLHLVISLLFKITVILFNLHVLESQLNETWFFLTLMISYQRQILQNKIIIKPWH